MLVIRREEERDRQAVENITRRAFYNQYMPGCFEHYLVRVMRGHPDFLPELNFVAELNGEVIGSIMYTRSTLTDEDGAVREAVTFGPLSIAPEHQRRGYGRRLMEHSFRRAAELGHDVIVILGSPANYVGVGFQCCKRFNVCAERQAAQCLPGGRNLSGGDAGQGASPRRAGREAAGLPAQPGDGH